jgi:hypothetical protein
MVDFFNILEDMYKDVLFSIKLPDGITETFNSSIGVKQGCILIPFYSLLKAYTAEPVCSRYQTLFLNLRSKQKDIYFSYKIYL